MRFLTQMPQKMPVAELDVALCGVLMYTLPTLIVVILALRRANRFSKEQLGDHLRDYPWSPAGSVLKGGK